MMGKSPEPTIRPVSELYYNKSPEDALFHIPSSSKDKAIWNERSGSCVATSDGIESDVERTRLKTAGKKARGYEPTTDEERALDKSLNFKLDTIVVLVCAINFVLQGVDKGNLGNAATTKSNRVHPLL